MARTKQIKRSYLPYAVWVAWYVVAIGFLVARGWMFTGVLLLFVALCSGVMQAKLKYKV
jgi:hypothetical protein